MVREMDCRYLLGFGRSQGSRKQSRMKWVQRACLGILCLLAAWGAWDLWPRSEPVVDIFYPTDFATAPEGIVGFPTFNAKRGSDFHDGGEYSVRQTAGGILVLPDEASADNQVPAMVILHGSGGDWSGRNTNLAMFLADHGIAGFGIDTFTSRNLRKTDDYLQRLEKAPIYTQMADALSALQALQEHPFIDQSRIGVTGFSLGAGSTLYMMFEPVIETVLGKNGPRFSAYAMFYGGCKVDFSDFRIEGSPLLIMMGEQDESMSIPACEAFAERLGDMGVEVELVVYPGAGHAWDAPYPQEFFPDKIVTRDCLMHWGPNGEATEMTSGKSMDTAFGAFSAMTDCSHSDGYTLGRNEAALEKSQQDLLNFLRQTWRLQEG